VSYCFFGSFKLTVLSIKASYSYLRIVNRGVKSAPPPSKYYGKMAPPLEDVRPKFELSGRNYIVTGGAQGIGFACARAICEMGGNVVIMDIQDQPVEEYIWLPKKFGIKTYYIKTDVTKEEELNASFAKAIDFLGTLGGLVPCAGIAIDKPFTEQTWAEMTRIQELNVSSNSFCHCTWNG
jgi:hypothetical protein